jgi:hypothetical protein
MGGGEGEEKILVPTAKVDVRWLSHRGGGGCVRTSSELGVRGLGNYSYCVAPSSLEG